MHQRWLLMKKIIPFVSVVLVLIVAGCTSTTQHTQNASSINIIGNRQLIAKIQNLSALSNDNATTVEMLQPLKVEVGNDSYASDLVNEAIWLTKYEEYEHSGHSFAFLLYYVNDGTKILCPGHELEHIQLFMKHNDLSLMNETINGIEESYPTWKQLAYQRKEKFPNIYRNLDNLSAVMEDAITKVKAGNYSINDDISFVSANNLC